MGEIKLQAATRQVLGKSMVVTQKTTYSTIPSKLLIARVAQTANIKENTARAALLGIKEAVRYFVINGHSVNLGKFGYLKLRAQASSVAKASQVSAELIKKITIGYQPSKDIKGALAEISFTSK